MATTTQHTRLKLSARSLLTDDEFSRVAALVVRDNEVTEDLAERITDEALKFLSAAATNTTPGRHLRPSKTVDMGWHALILHTELYAGLCRQLGRTIHHRPEGPETLRRDATKLADTVASIREAGFEPDEYLWGALADTEITAGDCMHSECTDGGSNCAAPPLAP